MNSHYGWAYIIRCRPGHLSNLLHEACKHAEKDKLWQQWLQVYPHMVIPGAHTKDNKPALEWLPFNDFYDRYTTPVSQKTDREILDDVAQIRSGIGR